MKSNRSVSATSIAVAMGVVLIASVLAVSSHSLGKIKRWQQSFVNSQTSLPWMASAMVLERQRLNDSLANYVAGDTNVSKDDLVFRLDIFWSRFGVMEKYYTDSFRRLTDPPVDGLPVDNEVAEIERIIPTIQKLSIPTLSYLEQAVADLQPGDTVELATLMHQTTELGYELAALELAAFERARYLNGVYTTLNERMTRRLNIAYVAIATGLLLIGLAMYAYIRQKRQGNERLTRLNGQLLKKIDEAECLTAELSRSARHDSLTGLLNRSGFNVVMENLLESSNSQQHGLCFIDLDLFKVVNDTSGHAAGDHLLQTAAGMLASHVPDNGYTIRLGGDEFLLLVPNTTEVEFRQVVDNCVKEFNPLRFNYDQRSFDVSASFGATLFNAADHTQHTAMAVVDAACYEAKHAGGGRALFHNGDEGTVESRQSEMKWVRKIQRALNERRMCLYHQQIHTASSTHPRLHSREILVRLIEEDGTIVAPGTFLDIAERYALAPKLDRYIVEEAFSWINQNKLADDEQSIININLSGRSIGDADFLQHIETQAANLSGPANKICFEITETAAVGKNARDFLLQLKQMGFLLALDDFGSGFSSFGYLEKLPIDYIKIDGLFVSDIDTNPVHQEFVRAINTVGKAMGKYTVAEFVENHQSLCVLEDIGLDFVQGYHLHKPEELPGGLQSAVLRCVA